MSLDTGNRAREGLARLPRGGTLPEEIWWGRHRAITLIAWIQVPLLLIVGRATDVPLGHLLFEVGLVALAATTAAFANTRLLGSTTATFALVTTSALLVHFSHGLIEMHFHFFVVVAVITLYQDWRPFLLGLGYVVVHHALFGTLQPHDVYNHPAALANPRLWALIHGVFVLAASVAGVVNWRFNEKMAGRLRGSVEALASSEARFRALIQNSFDVVAVVDAELRFTYVSSAAENATGHRPEELLGRRLTDLVHPADTDIAREALDSLVKGRERHASFEVRLADGEEQTTWIEIRATDRLVDNDIDGIVLNYHNVSTRREVQQENDTLATLVAASPDAILRLTTDGIIVGWNKGAEGLYGYTADEVAGRHFGLLIPPELEPQVADVTERVKDGERVPAFDTVRIRKDGARIHVSLTIFPLCDGAGQVTGIASIARDISEQHQAQEMQTMLQTQLRHAQKMQSVGQLAGGIAHDFNNILAIVLNYASFLKDSVEDPEARKDLDEIVNASQRGAALVRQLLLFSRKEVSHPENLNVDEVIRDAEGLLRRSVGEDVLLEVDLGGPLRPVLMDRSQLDQILINLAVNARDAMAAGGRLGIRTSEETLGDQVTQVHPEMLPGRYVCLAFSDTGHGMSKDIQRQIFDPFFTTKQRGEGTGLGLATVYGIVKQARGFIYVYSERGRGTTFRIYLPPSEEPTERVDVPRQPTSEVGGQETVLVVEDDRALREMVRRILAGAGYETVVAADPNEAIAASRSLDRLDLVLTDVVMPVMTGRALAETIWKLRGPVRVAFMSGYTSDVITRRGELEEGYTLLQKPFSSGELLLTIRQALDEKLEPLPSSPHDMSVLIVDDEPVFRDFLKVVLEDVGRVGDVRVAATGREALELCEDHQPEIVFVDSLTAPMSGTELASKLRERPAPPILVAVTAAATSDDRSWADSVIYKGARLIDEITQVVEQFRR